jgi:RNA polymerase sigma factor (sigma-70 family)
MSSLMRECAHQRFGALECLAQFQQIGNHRFREGAFDLHWGEAIVENEKGDIRHILRIIAAQQSHGLARHHSRPWQTWDLMSAPDSALAVRGQFTSTHWSMVLAAGSGSAPAAEDALERLCRTYWYPLYAFVRRLGNAPADAQDLTQGFFVYLLERQLVAKADRQAGRFRSFLLGSLKHFLAHEHERATALKRGGGQALLSLDQCDPEERYALEPSDTATPETIFDQRWALQQIENALKQLRAEYAASGRGPLFDLLKDYVWGDKNALTLVQIAGRIELTEEAVKKSVQRLRQRFRDSLRAEVAQTVATPDQIDEELRDLRAALAGHR